MLDTVSLPKCQENSHNNLWYSTFISMLHENQGIIQPKWLVFQRNCAKCMAASNEQTCDKISTNEVYIMLTDSKYHDSFKIFHDFFIIVKGEGIAWVCACLTSKHIPSDNMEIV